MSSLLQREVKAQASALSLSGLSIHSTEYAELKERRNKLKGKLAAFGDLPTVSSRALATEFPKADMACCFFRILDWRGAKWRRKSKEL